MFVQLFLRSDSIKLLPVLTLFCEWAIIWVVHVASDFMTQNKANIQLQMGNSSWLLYKLRNWRYLLALFDIIWHLSAETAKAGLSNLCRDAQTTPRQREPRDAATDAETRTISDSIDRSLTRDTCDCDYCDYYDAERLMMIARRLSCLTLGLSSPGE